jgi:hypothetical protein
MSQLVSNLSRASFTATGGSASPRAMLQLATKIDVAPGGKLDQDYEGIEEG